MFKYLLIAYIFLQEKNIAIYFSEWGVIAIPKSTKCERVKESYKVRTNYFYSKDIGNKCEQT